MAETRSTQWRGNWIDLLTHNEHGYVQVYSQKFNAKFGPLVGLNDCWNLGDNPTNCQNWSCSTGRIPTFRLASGSSLFWYPAAQRPLTTLEKLACMSWPVYGHLASQDMQVIVPSRQEARHMLGNARHLGNGSMVLLSALASVRLNLPCS